MTHASVDAVVELKNRFKANFIGVIKTNHSQYPKKWIEQTMQEWPPGSHLVLEATHNGVVIYACGYKYNKRKCVVLSSPKEQAIPNQDAAMKLSGRTKMGTQIQETYRICRPYLILHQFQYH